MNINSNDYQWPFCRSPQTVFLALKSWKLDPKSENKSENNLTNLKRLRLREQCVCWCGLLYHSIQLTNLTGLALYSLWLDLNKALWCTLGSTPDWPQLYPKGGRVVRDPSLVRLNDFREEFLTHFKNALCNVSWLKIEIYWV